MELNYEKVLRGKIYKETLEAYREGKFKIDIPGSVKKYYVTQEIPRRQWIEYYSIQPGYVNLGRTESGRIKVGFIVGKRIPFGCKEAKGKDRLEIERYEEQNYQRVI